MKNKYVLMIFFIFIFTIFLFGTISYAGEQKLNNLKYDVVLNADGTAEITETWSIRVSDTNTLFKTFDINESKYGEIINVTVEEITENGLIIPFRDTGEYAYHVEKNGYYALATNEGFEIAWGVSIDNTENKIYRIKYIILDAVKTYNDCSEFYWQFIGSTNAIPAKKVSGKITLPSSISDKLDLRAWAHGPLNGNVEITSNKSVSFEVSDLPAKRMVELRVVTSNYIFSQNNNIYEIECLDTILSEEEGWANEANKKRQMNARIFYIAAGLSGLVGLYFIIKIVKYSKILKTLKASRQKGEIQYFRDIPDEKATPAQAAFLYYFDKETAFKGNISKIVSAIILDLALKKAIYFEEGKKEEIFILINEEAKNYDFKSDERNIYELLEDVKVYIDKKNKNKEEISKISMKDIEAYAKHNDKKFLSKIEGLEVDVKREQKNNGNYDIKLVKEAESWSTKSILYYTLPFCMVALIAFLPLISFIILPVIILGIVCGIICTKIAKNARRLTEKGQEEQIKWKGLKRYMEEFSLLNEREVPELVLWEKYLVFATAFGIADKVIKQLKVKYPQITDETYMTNNGYIYIHMANRININRTIDSGIQRAYNSGINARAERTYSNYSSGSGFGGGFSGGGRRSVAGGGRNGRQIGSYETLLL